MCAQHNNAWGGKGNLLRAVRERQIVPFCVRADGCKRGRTSVSPSPPRTEDDDEEEEELLLLEATTAHHHFLYIE